MSDQPQPEEKTYSLKGSETNLLRFVQQHQQAVFAALLSNIASERLAYKVSETTQFELNGDMSQMKLREMPLPDQPETPAKPDGPAVVAAPDREQPAAPEPTQTEESN